MKYENFNYSSKDEVNALLNTGNNDTIINTLIGAVNGIDDRKWLQDICLNYISHADFWVVNTAIISIGNIARIHKKIDEVVIVTLQTLEGNQHSEAINNTLEDIMIFTK